MMPLFGVTTLRNHSISYRGEGNEFLQGSMRSPEFRRSRIADDECNRRYRLAQPGLK